MVLAGAKKKYTYSPKKYSNPYFKKRRRSRLRNRWPELSWRIRLALLCAVSILFLVIWVVLLSPVFKISDIKVSIINPASDNLAPGVRIDAQDIEDLAWKQTRSKLFGVIPGSNLFLFSTGRFTKNLDKIYYFSSLEVQKKPFHTLEIVLREMEYSLLWHENEKYFYADMGGNIIVEISPLDINKKQYPLIYNQGIGKINGNRIDARDIIYFVVELFGKCRDSLKDLNIERFILDNDINTVKLATTEGQLIYFNTREDITKQVNKLKIVIEEKLNNDINDKSYIDLRYGDRVYYR